MTALHSPVSGGDGVQSSGRWDAGSVLIEVTGRRLEAFINLAAGRGIWLRDVQWLSGALRCWVRAEDFRRLRPVVRRSGCRVHILSRRGALFYWRALFRRRSMLVGLVVCLLLVAASSSVIWTVEVEGLQEREPEEVLEAARRLGVAPGVPVFGLDLQAIARALERELPFVTWAALQRRGVRVTIKIVERVGEMPDPDQAVDIVASRDGVVRDVSVLAGIPMVVQGDEVREGAVLIRAEPGESAGEEISARGQILATVWYTEKESVQLSRKTHVPTGREHVRTLIRVGEEDSITIAGGREIPFEEYVTSHTRRSLLGWEIFSLPIYIETVYYREMSAYVRDLREPQAIRIACARAQHRIRSSMGPEGRVISSTCTILKRDGDRILIESSVKAIEDIGEERRVEP